MLDFLRKHVSSCLGFFGYGAYGTSPIDTVLLAKNAFGRPGKFVADNAENAAPASDFEQPISKNTTVKYAIRPYYYYYYYYYY